MHDLVAADTNLLPLSGSPRLIVLGREVLLGSGYADLLAIEPDGRPVVIETKLRNNPALERFVVWAQRLADEGLAELYTYFGKRGEVVLRPCLMPERVGLISLWRWTDDSAVLTLWRSVFERRAPTSIERVESTIAPTPLGKGNTIYDVSDDLLAALHDAYAEANRKRS